MQATMKPSGSDCCWGKRLIPHLETLTPSLYSGKTASCATGCCLGLSDKLWPLEGHGGQETAEMLLFVVWGGGVERPTVAPKVHHISPTWGGGDANAGEAWEKLPETPHVSCIPGSQTPHWKPEGMKEISPSYKILGLIQTAFRCGLRIL